MPVPRVRPENKPTCFDDVIHKIDHSGLTTETKNVFKIMMDFMRTLTNERNSNVTELENKLEAEKIDKETKLADLNSELHKTKTENENLRAQINKMANKHDELEAYGRRESLIFSGTQIKPFESNENCVLIAKNLIQNVLKVPVDPLISTAHRMGKPPAPGSSAPDKRAIIVKFVCRDDKFLILKTARNQSTRVQGLYVNESLTPIRSKILYVLRQAKRMNGSLITGTSTMNGKVFVHHRPAANAPESTPSLRTEINTRDKLHDFCENFIKHSLESFLDEQGRIILP